MPKEVKIFREHLSKKGNPFLDRPTNEPIIPKRNYNNFAGEDFASQLSN